MDNDPRSPNFSKAIIYSKFGLNNEKILLIKETKTRMHQKLDLPKNFKEFKHRVAQLLASYFKEVFGTQHYLKNKKSLKGIKREPTIKNLIAVLGEIEKQSTLGVFYCHHEELSDGYLFLKLALEQNRCFSIQEQSFLGIFTDHSPINKPQKRRIGIQSAAQVLWFEKKGAIFSIKKMKEEIWRHKQILEFLCLLEPATGRPIQLNDRKVRDMISGVDPRPKEKRKGFRIGNFQLENEYYSKVIIIPGLFHGTLNNGSLNTDFSFDSISEIVDDPSSINCINFPKLRIAIMALAKIQPILGFSPEEIGKGAIISAYKKQLKYYPTLYVNDWVEESLSSPTFASFR